MIPIILLSISVLHVFMKPFGGFKFFDSSFSIFIRSIFSHSTHVISSFLVGLFWMPLDFTNCSRWNHSSYFFVVFGNWEIRFLFLVVLYEILTGYCSSFFRYYSSKNGRHYFGISGMRFNIPGMLKSSWKVTFVMKLQLQETNLAICLSNFY